MLNFEDLKLSKPLLNALQELDYIHPTPIQEKSFSVIKSGKDVIGIAQTGTGKTFAYLLPILSLYQYTGAKSPKTLILVPTRELVLQVGIATDLFKSGLATYFEVLMTQRSALQSKLELVTAKKRQYNATINIYRALGGGWK